MLTILNRTYSYT